MPDPYSLQDTVMVERFHQIVEEYRIKVIVETGTYHGLSTMKLAEMCPIVFTIENYMWHVLHAVRNFSSKRQNIVLCLGNSPDVLQTLSSTLPDETLYFLDAHWQDYWPLIHEIQSIRKGTGVIVIHDTKVPGRPELGYDSYNGQDLDYEYVKDALTEWSPHHQIQYNERVDGTELARGVLYAFPR